jgi:excisionase family DNA binding protein
MQDYVTVSECARLVGLSTSAIYLKIREGRLPFIVAHGLKWIRRSDLHLALPQKRGRKTSKRK